MKSSAKLKKIKGDASFREFYRNRKNKSIIVISKKEKLKNLLIYDAINKILIKNNILAPNLLSENYINNLDIFEKDNKLITLIEWPQLIADKQDIKFITLTFNYLNQLNDRTVDIKI